MRERIVAAAAATAALAALAGCGGQPSTQASGAVPTSTAQVIRTDIVSRQRLTGTLTYAGAYTLINEAGPGIYTALPPPGALISRGQVLYRVNGRAVPLLYGDPAWRAIGGGVSDAGDVKQLEQNLLVLGFGNSSNLVANGHFDWHDAAAVRRWQASLGLPQTGTVALGDAVYAPGPIRVASVNPVLGMPAQPGEPVLEATSPQHAVLVALDVSREGLVKVGDAVTVGLPDGQTTLTGTITTIGAVASAAGPNGGSPTVAMTVTLADPTAGGSLDQAPVSVDVTDAVHHAELAVPVMALLAQAGGTFAVVAVDGSQRRIVAVKTGLFDDRGLVEVSGAGLAEGMWVEVPQA
jgi:peptidoglycan hydrolase-like protein with peptidoglycan-binding domain